MKTRIICALICLIFRQAYSQSLRDTVYNLPSVNIHGKNGTVTITRLPEISGTNIYSGKKNEVIMADSLNANLGQNTARQVFAKVPGINSWELDGSGTQTNVGARGLNPHRSWEFNVNQNGCNVNNDLYGYPEAMYNPPLDAVKEIQDRKSVV